MGSPWKHPVIWKEVEALMAIPSSIEGSFDQSVDLILHCTGRVICTGVGKSGHIAQKIAATMSSTGTPAMFMHPTEAAHGDLGALLKGDVVLMFSRSGRAIEMLAICSHCKKYKIPIILVSENNVDSLAGFAATVLQMPLVKEAWGHAPTTSTILQMAIGDALAITLAQKKGFTNEDFQGFHPGGELGKQTLDTTSGR